MFNLFAYIDPGVGSMIWQLLAAVGIGFIFYFRRFFTWIKFLFIKEKKEESNEKDN